MRFADFWSAVVVPRLDTPAMQEGTWAPGRVYPGWLAPDGPPPGSTQAEQWGRTLIEPGRGFAPELVTSDYLQVVRFVVVTEVNDYEPPAPIVFDALKALEQMQEEAKRLLDGWLPHPFVDMKVAFRIKREIAPQPGPQWDAAQRLWWLSSTYRFVAAN